MALRKKTQAPPAKRADAYRSRPVQKCSCGGRLRLGFVPDFAERARYVSLFVGGRPQARKSLLAKMFKGFGIEDWDEDDVWMLSAYRCDACGRVEFFAVDPPISGVAG